METPSSMRTITRSQAASSSSSSLHTQKKTQDHPSVEKGRGGAHSKQERGALLDITNDSPIVGVATGSLKTPASSVPKSKCCPLPKRTPGSGEALLRGQVKTLLQKVEEESELVKPADDPAAAFRVLLGHLRSPSGLLAPTPANTPQIIGVSEESADGKIAQVSATAADVVVVVDDLAREFPLEECQINRALLFDSPEKSDMSASSSSLTFQGSTCSFPEKFPEDDCSSTWSIQANASSERAQDDEEEELEDFVEEGEDAEDDEYYEDDDDGGLLLDDLCEGLRNMSVFGGEEKSGLPEFSGKHTRFVYNSDGELEGEEEVEGNRRVVSPNVVLLKGLPAPKGKHLRFQEKEEEE